MGRSSPTGVVERAEHSIAELPWRVIRGALGPSDGSAGALSNVPSALSVLRHAPLYRGAPAEIEEAFAVLETHSIRHRVLYPVAVTVAPFLFDILLRGSPHAFLAERISDLLAQYAASASTLEAALELRLSALLVDRAGQIMVWLDTHPRAAAAMAIHVPALRPDFYAAITLARTVPAEALLALAELDGAPGTSHASALALLGGTDPMPRMAAAAFLARRGDSSADLTARVAAALPPTAAADLAAWVGKLWYPTVAAPEVAPRICVGRVVEADAAWVQVEAGGARVTVPWVDSYAKRGDVVTVGLLPSGAVKLLVRVDANGGVQRIDF